MLFRFGPEDPKLISKNRAPSHHYGLCKFTFPLVPQQPGLINSLSGLTSHCPETLERYFKQVCRGTGCLVSWFIQQYWGLQLWLHFPPFASKYFSLAQQGSKQNSTTPDV